MAVSQVRRFNSMNLGLAYNGVLFLDELPEFHRRSLEVLRQPLEQGVVTIARALRSTTFPARFVLVAAMNPCPCGYLGDPRHSCKCAPTQIERYMGRISGPLFSFCMYHPVGSRGTVHRRRNHGTTAQTTARARRTKIGARGRVGSSRSRTRTTPPNRLANKYRKRLIPHSIALLSPQAPAELMRQPRCPRFASTRRSASGSACWCGDHHRR
jgi:magnesium chelatase family protein